MAQNQDALPEPASLDDLRRKLHQALDFHLVEIGEVDAGAVHNNRLLWVRAETSIRTLMRG